MENHTPLPWKVEPDSRPDILTVSGKGGYFDEGHLLHMDKYEGNYKDAALIVRAVNAHDDLIDALKQFVDEKTEWDADTLDLFADNFRRLIAKAEGK